MLEVVSDEFERVAEGSDGGQTNVEALLFLPRALHHGGQDGVGVGDQTVPQLLVLALADEANAGQRGLLLVLVAFADVANQAVHQIRPLVTGQLDSSDGGNDLGGSLAGLAVGRSQGLEGELLDACLGILVGLVEPFCLEGSLVGKLSRRECILQGDTGGRSDVALGTLICQLLDEGCEILGLVSVKRDG